MLRRCLSIWLALVACAWACAALAQPPEQPDYAAHVKPLLEQYCFDCHGYGSEEGGVQFDGADSIEALVANKKLWGKVWDNVLTETMPPSEMPQPSADERKLLSRWIGQSVFQLNPESPDPGRVTIRRLNRVEYRYTVRDLLGIDFPVKEHFPVDDTGYGFDTIGDVLTVPPTLMDKYFIAASRISARLLREATGPENKRTDAYRKVFGEGMPEPNPDEQLDPGEQLQRAHEIVKRIATRAYRRPVDDATVEKLLGLTKPAFEAGDASAEEMVCRAIEVMLVSPRFIYRSEFQLRPDEPDDEPGDEPDSVQLLDEYSLASRLSYFLWSSLPDQELFDLAAAARLREELRPQVERMLRDSKSQRFVENFVGQWLQTRDVQGIHRSKRNGYHDKVHRVRSDMKDETYEFFKYIMREDRDVIELISADYSFLTEDLAKFYGVPDVHGSEPQYVKLPPDSPRGGILTHGSVLMVTSNPDRTSPVKRGLFLLENVLGSPPPPPPPDVPALEESKHSKHEQVSLREQLARHRADPSCAVCHDRMDPLGLALENFDAIGQWREEDNGQPIDASSQLTTGEEFSDIRELRSILAEKQRLFYRCFVRKLMTYALGRGIEYTDTLTVERIVDAMLSDDSPEKRGRFSTMLMGIIESPQFQMHRDQTRRDNNLQNAKVQGGSPTTASLPSR